MNSIDSDFSLVDLEKKILTLCQSHPKGLTDSILQDEMPNVNVEQRVSALNRLLSAGNLDLFKSDSQLIYKLKDPDLVSKNAICENTQEKLVYQVIGDAGNKGIWSRDIRLKCNLQMTQLNKILRNLESKKLIKAVKSVTASKKKLYMLFNLDPDISVTGGAWYSDQDFESEFVEVLNQQCYRCLVQKASNSKLKLARPRISLNNSFASSEEVWKIITNLKISKVTLTVTDIETILNTLIYDGKAEMKIESDPDGQEFKLYRAVKPIIDASGLEKTPCGICPVIDQCYENGAISPATCIYMKEWLES
ncbi:DNA-directed RNA polymerase III subunit RPC6 [Trichoplax sp. H2]|nr:DNA-directed RNA polymerase III subunit RPC6 [Trichoplax sp. H2]|eukprot:RDD44343.1 DNA-directed RNA polymerase III subunit RPC6 [Trichoplax sp. H2]